MTLVKLPPERPWALALSSCQGPATCAILPPHEQESSTISHPPTDTATAPEGAFGVFAERQFRWLFTGNIAFFFAMQGQMLTRTILAWDLTGQATSLAYINLVVAVPLLFASVLGGAITDRVERRQLVIIGQALILANELFILVLLILGRLEFWHMLCTAFVAGCAFPFIMPARMAITATVVGPRRMQSAMAFSGGVMNLSRVAGPAIMGIVIAQYSAQAAYILSSILYVMAILCMFGVHTSRSAGGDRPRQPLFTDVAGGFSYLFGNRPMLVCLLFGLIPMFVAMPFQNILVMLAEQAWQRDESGVGTLMAIGGIGGVLGSIWIVRRGDSADRLKLMLGATLAFGVFLGLFAQTPGFYLALIPLLLANACASAAQTVNNAAIQILTDDEMRGRMSSLMMMSFGLTPIGVFPMAIAADNFGAANAITGACLFLAVMVLIFYFSSATLRNLDHSVNKRMDQVPSHPTVPG